ncbi:glycoside hydrolase family 78 protein [Actinophytocola algeriensis]|uniref:alpha-L-rhamnosidase n=1 Tax=Actinophytocola algeriensis TaxID=1768010 RepID=A0A7W7VI10_9PSEU|nr:glycoside hydrolase family 78 protein [Actinophytocola algeriensis]MBB4910996.1 alpha-L-rhamnosidase [Actinophytocola algeriensis]MBE1473989.1 alpha-L-rhamnosidase [Actinophytocola algeriensis]
MPSAAAPTGIRFEHHDAPVLGIGHRRPRLSWRVPDAGTGYRQRAYEIALGEETFVVESAEQVLVPWPGDPLAARERVEVRVRVRDDEWSPWSLPATVEAGLSPADWTARMISPDSGIGDPAPVLAATLTVPADVVSARLHATAHGVYVAELNGHRVGDHVLAPGWTSYHHRLRYQTHDVTDLVLPGENTVEVLLGNGWYRGRLGFRGDRAHYGDRLGLLAQLEVTTADGAVHVLATDGTWTARQSGVLADDLYDGQRTDLRGVTGKAVPVDVLDTDLSRLVAPDGPPVRITGELPAVAMTTSPSGATIVDFGQNLVGWVRLRVRGAAAGAEVVVRHAEVLADGELCVRPLRTASATDSYVLADGDAVLEPALTFHGFRYAEVTGVPGLRAEDVTAVVVGTDLRRTGWFSCSHPLLDRFHENVVWSARGNFLDVPTDCPQRDERLGWTGDIQVFAPAAEFLFDSTGFLTSWLADLACEQHDNGAVPFVVPDVLAGPPRAAAAWGDAAVLVPWTVHQRTGDRELLARQFASMRAWVDHVAGLAGKDRLWTGGFQFGDWLDPAAPPEDPFAARADPDVVATAHLARSAQVVADTADLLGDDPVARRYADLAAQVREAFAREYATEGGRLLSDSATVYALALVWGLLPAPEQRARAGERLADLVRTAGFRTATGFVGTPLIMDALTEAGELDVAYRLLLQTGCPSWLYPVTMGATTVWERWDSLLPDGTVNPGEMTSFNHYALGAVADWLHRAVAGLAPASPGYRELLVRPRPRPALTWATARHDTPYGQAAVSWQRADGRFLLHVTVPVGATATVHVPGRHQPVWVHHGRHDWDVPDPCGTGPGTGPGLPGDPTVRDVLDHEPTWTRVVEAATATGEVPGEEAAAARLARYLDAPATQLVDAITHGGFAPHAAELRRLLAPLFEPGH